MTAHLHLAPALTETDSKPSVSSPVRVVLADDHASMRRSLRLLLDGEEFATDMGAVRGRGYVLAVRLARA